MGSIEGRGNLRHPLPVATAVVEDGGSWIGLNDAHGHTSP